MPCVKDEQEPYVIEHDSLPESVVRPCSATKTAAMISGDAGLRGPRGLRDRSLQTIRKAIEVVPGNNLQPIKQRTRAVAPTGIRLSQPDP